MAKKQLVFYGAKTLAIMASDIAHEADIEIIGYIDDFEDESKIALPNFLGTLNDNLYLIDKVPFVIAVGDNINRRKLSIKINQLGGKIANLIHPLAYISKSTSIGQGNILFPFAYLGTNVTIGDGNVFFPNTIISHDINIGDYCFFAPSVAVAGFVEIQNEVKFATSSSISANSLLKSGTQIINDSNWTSSR